MKTANSRTRSRLVSLYATNRTLIRAECDRVLAARDALKHALDTFGTTTRGGLDTEVEGLVSGCFRVWHRIEKVVAESPFHTVGGADPFGVSGSLALGDIDKIEKVPLLTKEWDISEVRALLTLLERGARILDGWSVPTRQMALYEMLGQGRIAEVDGDLTNAKHLAVYVPGMGTDIWDFDHLAKTRTANVRSRAMALASPPDAEIVTITWLGYDPPRDLDVVGAAHEELARSGGEALSKFLRDMVAFAPPGVHVTVLAHSYGSVLAGLAARDYGLAADELVVLGSPGLGVKSADQLKLLPGGRVWAAQAHDDPVAWVPKLEDHHLHLHGPSPTGPSFGATVFAVSGTGHSSYFQDEQALVALAAITVNRITEGQPAIVAPR